MKKFFILTGWQLKLLVKYNILTIALIIALIYTALLRSLPGIRIDMVVVSLIFSDPSMLGFIFIGAIILFEKSDNTLPALVVTPMKQWEFLWSRAIALLIPALIGSFGIALAGWGFHFRIVPLFVSVSLSSILFTFIGFIGATRVKTFNQYMIIIPLFLAPAAIPLINYFELVHWPILYLMPTQSTLDLLSYSTKPTGYLPFLLNSFYLIIWIIIAYKLSIRAFNKTLLAS
jgi:fluoroquinolone transport system permease protein